MADSLASLPSDGSHLGQPEADAMGYLFGGAQPAQTYRQRPPGMSGPPPGLGRGPPPPIHGPPGMVRRRKPPGQQNAMFRDIQQALVAGGLFAVLSTEMVNGLVTGYVPAAKASATTALALKAILAVVLFYIICRLWLD